MGYPAISVSQPKLIFILTIFNLLLVLLVCGATNPIVAQAAATRDALDKNNTQAKDKQPSLENVRELQRGQVSERELKDGETHRYSVALKAGEYMKVSVQNFNIDFAMDAFDPGGNAIAKIAPGNSGPTDSLWVVAETTGEFQIRIASIEGK